MILFHTLTIISSLENRALVLAKMHNFQLVQQILIIFVGPIIKSVFKKIGFLGILSLTLIGEFRSFLNIRLLFKLRISYISIYS